MLLLIDMDDVLADFNRKIGDLWIKKHPDKLHVAYEDRRRFRLQDEPGLVQYKEQIKEIRNAPGFIFSLPPLPLALESMAEIKEKGIEAFICTSPLWDYENCVGEKYEWVDHYLGRYWVERLILTRDKTLVTGDYLIDDKPVITGLCKPTWEHIVFDQPYNRHITDKKRMTWANWKEVLGI